MDSFIKIFTYFAALHALVFPSGNAISNLVRCISGRSQQWLIKMGVVGGRSLFCCNLSMQINIFDGFQRSYYLWKVWTRRPLCLVLALNKQITNSSDGTWLWLVFTCTQNKKKNFLEWGRKILGRIHGGESKLSTCNNHREQFLPGMREFKHKDPVVRQRVHAERALLPHPCWSCE